MSKFKQGDKVSVNTNYSKFAGWIGTVNFGPFADGAYTVSLHGDTIVERGFFESELELLEDPQRETLIALVETLDAARKQANAIEIFAIQSQRGVYGQIVLSIHDVLEQVVGEVDDPSLDADRVYLSMMQDGNTVREALKALGL